MLVLQEDNIIIYTVKPDLYDNLGRKPSLTKNVIYAKL